MVLGKYGVSQLPVLAGCRFQPETSAGGSLFPSKIGDEAPRFQLVRSMLAGLRQSNAAWMLSQSVSTHRLQSASVTDCVDDWSQEEEEPMDEVREGHLFLARLRATFDLELDLYFS